MVSGRSTVSTVDAEVGARHEGRGVAEEEHGRADKVLGLRGDAGDGTERGQQDSTLSECRASLTTPSLLSIAPRIQVSPRSGFSARRPSVMAVRMYYSPHNPVSAPPCRHWPQAPPSHAPNSPQARGC